MSDPMVRELVYLSWGGSGRGVAFRDAYERAVAEQRGIVYLAILDSSTFGDLDRALLDFVVEELTWLLEAQLRLVDREQPQTRVSTRTVVRIGDIGEEVADLVEGLGTDLVLIGAPIPLSADGTVDALVRDLSERTGAIVEVIGEPEAG